MKKLILIILLLNYASFTEACNKKTRRKPKHPLPEAVCVPENYIISRVYIPEDLNGDGLKDYIFKYRKENLENGDTIFSAIYFQNSDKTYSLGRTFDNLYSLYFMDYTIETYNSLPERLKSIRDRYYGVDPFQSIKFKKNTIEIEFKIDAMESWTFIFTYSVIKKDWIYTRKKSYIGYNNKTTMYEIEPEDQFPIGDFNFLDWL
jgi:hypothetical protein